MPVDHSQVGTEFMNIQYNEAFHEIGTMILLGESESGIHHFNIRPFCLTSCHSPMGLDLLVEPILHTVRMEPFDLSFMMPQREASFSYPILVRPYPYENPPL